MAVEVGGEAGGDDIALSNDLYMRRQIAFDLIHQQWVVSAGKQNSIDGRGHGKQLIQVLLNEIISAGTVICVVLY